MTIYPIKRLYEIGIISVQLKRVLVVLGCVTSKDMIDLSKDQIKIDYIERSYKLKDELFKAINDISELDDIIPGIIKESKPKKASGTYTQIKTERKRRKFSVGDFTEDLLKKSDIPIRQDSLLKSIKEYLPETYIASIRANLNSDPKKRFVFFLDGYIGLQDKTYDSRFQICTVKNKKIQHAEQRIIEFMSFIEAKHRSPQPHGLEEEESLYRWYISFMKSTSSEMAELRSTFHEYIKEYDKWMFTPSEYAYKRNCDQVKWYVDKNLDLPSPDDEPELSSWFNYQLEVFNKHKDKKKEMFIDLMEYLSDYGLHFCEFNKTHPQASIKEDKIKKKKLVKGESALTKYKRLIKMMGQSNKTEYLAQKILLVITIGNLIQSNKITSCEIMLNDALLEEFPDVCIDFVGTASSYNIAIPFYYLNEESFWSLIPKDEACFNDFLDIEPTYDYIEKTFSCAIIDQELFDLLSDNKGFESLKKELIKKI